MKWLASAAAVVFGAMAMVSAPRIPRNVAQWAEEVREVAAESGSSRSGKWSNDTTPLAIEPMECLSADYPCSEVVIKASAQLFKTEVGTNWLGQTICDDPCSFMAIFPSLDELAKYNNTKFDPTVEATPALKKLVCEVVERSGKGSTGKFKKFRGGYAVFTTASSSKGLQGVSIKRLWGDEVSEYPEEAGDRGDPVKQARARGDAHDDFKCLWTSTPKEMPNCRISSLYDEGDQRKYYAQCPHCQHYQVLYFENMLPPDRKGGRVAFKCIANGCVVDEIHKPFMLGQGRYWIRCYPSTDPENPAPPDHFPEEDLAKWRGRPSEGRNPSFWAWQAYSKLKSWTKIFAEYVSAMRDVETGVDPKAMKVFYQQKLGLAWDATSEAPDSQTLFDARGRFVKTRGTVPAWACDIYLAADVQGDRIEWDAYAVGQDLSFARFDWGVISVDPLENEAWAELSLVIARTWPGEATVDLGADLVGIDSGGKAGVTPMVYRFVNRRQNVIALKGSKFPDEVPLKKGKRDIYRPKDGSKPVSAEPWLVGGWAIKSVIYGMLGVSREAEDIRLPAGLYNPPDTTLEDFKQYVGEIFKQPKSPRAGAKGWWERIPGQANERLDLAVYAYALAWSNGVFSRTPAEWQARIAARLKTPESDMPLFAAIEMPVAPALPENPGNQRKSFFKHRSKV